MKIFKMVFIFLCLISMIFSACDLDWDGVITVTGGTKLPMRGNWSGYLYIPSINEIDVIEVKTKDNARFIIRIKTYKSFEEILTGQCVCTDLCNHTSTYLQTDKNVIENLLEKFSEKYFETKNLIITELVGSSITMNFQVNNISQDGIIYITETKKFTLLPINDSAHPVTFAIEIDSSFNTPSSMSVLIKTK